MLSGAQYCDFQVACLKQNTHVNKITNQSCHIINAVAISLLSCEYLYLQTTNLKRTVYSLGIVCGLWAPWMLC